eukprot:14789453-Alexandrium_andersonii.AAC.1
MGYLHTGPLTVVRAVARRLLTPEGRLEREVSWNTRVPGEVALVFHDVPVDLPLDMPGRYSARVPSRAEW